MRGRLTHARGAATAQPPAGETDTGRHRPSHTSTVAGVILTGAVSLNLGQKRLLEAPSRGKYGVLPKYSLKTEVLVGYDWLRYYKSDIFIFYTRSYSEIMILYTLQTYNLLKYFFWMTQFFFFPSEYLNRLSTSTHTTSTMDPVLLRASKFCQVIILSKVV